MPQLMPLNWVFSSVVMLLILISASVIYSEGMEMSGLSNNVINKKGSKSVWCW